MEKEDAKLAARDFLLNAYSAQYHPDVAEKINTVFYNNDIDEICCSLDAVISFCNDLKGFLNNNNMKVQVVNKSANQLPEYATAQSAGMDLRANIDETILLRPMERRLIPTGLHIQLPVGYEAQIRPRSGLALKHGITVLNSPGCVDSDYRGDVGVILINLSKQAFEIKPGERIAQMVVTSHEHVEWELADELDMSDDRGGGYGHTGVK